MWITGEYLTDWNGNGVKIKPCDRDTFFCREGGTIIIEMEGDLDLGHRFHETSQGIRYTISEDARREVLARLLRLNHERYEEEVLQGLHEKKKAKSIKGKKGKSVREEPGQYEMF